MTLRERARIDEGNRALDATIRLTAVCNHFGVPFALENPTSSYMWKDPLLSQALERATKVLLHQCAFGAAWRKATTIAFGNLK